MLPGVRCAYRTDMVSGTSQATGTGTIAYELTSFTALLKLRRQDAEIERGEGGFFRIAGVYYPAAATLLHAWIENHLEHADVVRMYSKSKLLVELFCTANGEGAEG